MNGFRTVASAVACLALLQCANQAGSMSGQDGRVSDSGSPMYQDYSSFLDQARERLSTLRQRLDRVRSQRVMADNRQDLTAEYQQDRARDESMAGESSELSPSRPGQETSQIRPGNSNTQPAGNTMASRQLDGGLAYVAGTGMYPGGWDGGMAMGMGDGGMGTGMAEQARREWADADRMLDAIDRAIKDAQGTTGRDWTTYKSTLQQDLERAERQVNRVEQLVTG